MSVTFVKHIAHTLGYLGVPRRHARRNTLDSPGNDMSDPSGGRGVQGNASVKMQRATSTHIVNYRGGGGWGPPRRQENMKSGGVAAITGWEAANSECVVSLKLMSSRLVQAQNAHPDL